MKCIYCPQGSYCVNTNQSICPIGSYSPSAGLSACPLCVPGTYANTTSSSVCYACQPTYSTYPGAYSASQCVCPTGSVYNGSICTCPPATYRVVNASAVGSWQCSVCPIGSYCLGGDTNPIACPTESYCLTSVSVPTPCTVCTLGTYESVSCLATRNRVCLTCTNKPSHSTYPVKSYSPACPWVCDSMYGGSTCAACAPGYWCLYGTMNRCPYNSISPSLSFAQNNCTCKPGYSSQGSAPGTSPCVKCQTGMICPGGQAAAPVVSATPLANITQAIMVQKPLPMAANLVALMLAVPGLAASMLASVTSSSSVAVYTRQVCRASYCITCDRSSACVRLVAVGVKADYTLNVTVLQYDVLYTFVPNTGVCAPTFSALPSEFVSGTMVALTSVGNITSVAYACGSNPSLKGTVAVLAASSTSSRRRLLQVSNDTLAVDFVVPANLTAAITTAIQAKNLTIQGYASTVAAPALIASCPAGSSSPEGSASLTDCTCLPGYEGNASNGTDCILCRNGTYCASGVLSHCPENAYSKPGSDSFFNCSCSPGFYGNTTCVECPLNAYCRGGMDIHNCTAIAVSAVQSTGPDACYCDRGYYGVANTPCYECEPGTWCWTGIRNVCPLNSVSAARSAWITDCACDDGHEAIMGVDGNGRLTRVCNLCAEATYCKVRARDLIFKGGGPRV